MVTGRDFCQNVPKQTFYFFVSNFTIFYFIKVQILFQNSMFFYFIFNLLIEKISQNDIKSLNKRERKIDENQTIRHF